MAPVQDISLRLDAQTRLFGIWCSDGETGGWLRDTTGRVVATPLRKQAEMQAASERRLDPDSRFEVREVGEKGEPITAEEEAKADTEADLREQISSLEARLRIADKFRSIAKNIASIK